MEIIFCSQGFFLMNLIRFMPEIVDSNNILMPKLQHFVAEKNMKSILLNFKY